MARYIGPKTKIARRFREAIYGPDKGLEKRNFPPGQHGPNKRRAKQSEYSIQLTEKQKAQYTYGILERQFSNLDKKASARPGDRVSVREKSKSLEAITMALATRKNFDWLAWNDSNKEGVFMKYPERVQIPENIREQLIVELYSK